MSTLRAYARGPVLTAPGPQSGVMLRNIGKIRKDPLSFLMQMQREHGSLVQFPVPVPASYFVADATDVRRVLIENARAYDKDTMQYRGLASLTGEGLLTADGEKWRDARRVVQPAFHHEAVMGMRDSIVHAAESACERWLRRDVIDIESEMMQMSLQIVGTTLFGADLSAEAADLSHATLQALDAVVTRAQRPWLDALHLPSRSGRNLRRALAELDAGVGKLVAHRLSQPRAMPDLLGMLMLAHGAKHGQSVPQAVRDEIVTFIVAGHETVASGLTWAWHLLMTHQDEYSRLQDAGSDDEVFARAVFEEVLRIYPPAWLITRRSLQTDVLSGREIPADALIIMSPWVVHRDPHWWTQPEKFSPQRFLESSDARRLAYLPFGFGQRMCIGREMALLEGAIALAIIARRVTFTAAGKFDGGRIASVTLRPAGSITARVQPR